METKQKDINKLNNISREYMVLEVARILCSNVYYMQKVYTGDNDVNDKIVEDTVYITDKIISAINEDFGHNPNNEILTIESYTFRRGDITDIYDVEKYKETFLNREAGFIIKLKNGNATTFSEKIPYESYSSEIYEKKDKWKKKMEEAIKLWKNE
jgi:hypothetical protein